MQNQPETNQMLRAICFDCGDTLVDEATEVKDERGITLYAELIPGAMELIRTLKRRAYRLALIADGRLATYFNVLTHYDLYHLFEVVVASETIGVEKPDPRIFVSALDQMRILPADYARTVMVGNNLGRDIKGANDLGMISVWLDWSPRRARQPADETELPQYMIKTPLELLDLLPQLEAQLRGRSQV